jgi:tRNA (cmo5U34)-methyltransferase
LPAVEDFNFDADVADVFDDMIRRSVPGYECVLSMLGVFASRFAQADSHVYDLGCSLGGATLSVRRALRGRRVHIVAADKSNAMIRRFAERLDRMGHGPTVELVCQDAREVDIKNASLVVLNFTLQFLPVSDRRALLRRIWRGLLPGGALVLSEKLSFARQAEQGLFADLHDEFRRQNGYSELEISQKRSALENVLFTETADQHLQRLVDVGFDSVHTWFRCANFGSFVALKSL